MSRKALFLVLILYMGSAGVSFAAFSYFQKGSSDVSSNLAQQTEGVAPNDEELTPETLIKIDPNEPKDQECPLTGQLFTKSEKDSWSAKRPLAVMVENHPDARPQSGLSMADVVFEAQAEGGVTRFMGIFYCLAQAQDVKIAPVRSARSYYLDWASGFNRPLYAHVGGANLPGPANALGQIREYDWHLRNDIDAMSVGYPTFARDYSRLEGKDLATEHTMVSSSDKLWQVGAKRSWTNITPSLQAATKKKTATSAEWLDSFTPWKFQDGEQVTENAAPKISYLFKPDYNDYKVEWSYDSGTNSYLRVMSGEPHVDLNNNLQISVKNVVVLLTDEKGPIDEKAHLLYTTSGTGTAHIFQNGTAIKSTWSKKDRQSPLIFKDPKGKDVEMVRGSIWISVLSKKLPVTF